MKVPTAAGWRSLDRKLPLLIACVILATVTAFSAGAYNLVQHVLLNAAGQRLLGVSAPIAISLEQSARQQRRRYDRLARDPAITRFLLSGRGREDALRALATATAGGADPQPGRVELRNAAGEVVLEAARPGAPAALDWADRVIQSGAAAAGNTVIAPLFARGDTVVGGSLVAVLAPDGSASAEPSGADTKDRTVVGYIVDTRVIVATGAQSVRDLVGKGAAVIVGSPKEGVWTDLERPAPPPPARVKPGAALVYDSSARGPGVGAATAIAGTPWVLWVEQPRAAILAPIANLLGELALLAFLFVVLGAVGAWALSRQVTGPIVALAKAADQVAAGAGVAPADGPQRDEVARLRDAFTRMSARVEESREKLEELVAERTVRLRSALGELEVAQQELVRKERLAMLGQLASAVGHELRNPLGVMTNALYVVEQCTPADAPQMVRDYIDMIRGQISASERIVGDLLDTARMRAPATETIDLREAIDSQVRRLGSPQGITVNVILPDDLVPVRMDPVQLSQILFNLMTNAVQAMNNEGTLTIAAVTHDARQRVELSVADTGPGISADAKDRIFEPLFTTKARGLGLGLWVSQTLAGANGASLRASSRPGEGATFTLDMPAAVEATSAAS